MADVRNNLIAVALCAVVASAASGCYVKRSANGKLNLDGVTEKVAIVAPVEGLEVDFGKASVNGSTDKLVVLINAGPTTATKLAESTTAPLTSPFSFKGGAFPGTGGDCGTELAEMQTCILVLTFSPTTSGAQTGKLTIDYNNGVMTWPLEVTLKGDTSASLAMQDDSTSYDYGNKAHGSSTDVTLTLENIGSVDASSIAESADAPLAAPFDFKDGNFPGTGGDCTATLTAGSTCTLVMTYNPTTSGEHTDELTLTYTDSDGINGTFTYALSGDVTNTAPTLAAPNSRVYPTDAANPPVLQSNASAYSFTPTFSDAETDPVTLSCTYETLGIPNTDPNYAASGTACTTLASLTTTNGTLVVSTASFNTTTGVLTWQPTNRQRGTFKFTLIASDGTLSSTPASFYVTVRENYATSALLAGFEAQHAEGTTGVVGLPAIPRTTAGGNNDLDNWLSVFGATPGSLAGFGSTTPWTGTGAASVGSVSPYALSFNSSGPDVMTAGTVMNGMTRAMFTAWIAPSSASSTDKVILSNGDSAGNGFTLRQSASSAGKWELATGLGLSYLAEVSADSPISHWRLGESAGTTATDAVGAFDGTYVNSPTLSVADALAEDSDTAVTFDGTDDMITADPTTVGNTYTFETWIYTTLAVNSQPVTAYFFSRGSAVGTSESFGIGGTSVPGNEGKLVLYNGNVSNQVVWSNTALSANTWYHVAFTRSGTTITFYLNGVADGGGTLTSTYDSTALTLGQRVDAFAPLQGKMDEPAIYNSALGASRLLAHHQAGVRTVCRTSTTFSDDQWNFVGGLFDGTNTQLFINGHPECSVTTMPVLANNATTMSVGATPTNAKAWGGKLADLKLYGTNDGSSPGSAVTMLANFAASANRFRATPVEDVLASGLIFHADAANADSGVRSYGSACGASTLSWFDQATAKHGVLTNFAACVSDGWQGTGTALSPFQLSFDGSNDYLAIPNVGLTSGSVEMWIKPSTVTGDIRLISLPSGAGAGLAGALSINQVSGESGSLWVWDGSANQRLAADATISANNWHHVVVVFSGGNATAYVNGTAYLTKASAFDFNAHAMLFGAPHLGTNGNYFSGGLAKLAVYGGALTQAQVRQNCHAQKARFSGVSCAGP